MRTLGKLFCWGTSSDEDDLKKKKKRKQKQQQQQQQHLNGKGREISFNKRVITYLACGMVSVVLGCLSFIWTPHDLLMTERLRMRKGLPPYDWWATPPNEVLMRVYLFNVTNYEHFMNGSHTKLHLQEIGPYVFSETLVHSNITKNDNSTLSYVAHRQVVFLPDMSALSLNETIFVPNIAVLGIPSYFAEANFMVKLGLNMMLRKYDSQPIVPMTVYDYFWNNKDPLLTMANKIAPSLAPVNNVGILSMIYKDFVDQVTVFIGTNNTRRFFTMDQYHLKPRFGFWPNETCDSVKKATEGVLYHQDIYKNDTLHFFRKTVCRVTPVYFEKELVQKGMTSYKFSLPLDTFHRPRNGSYDCYTLPDTKPLPDGLSDITPCYYDFPMAASMPHFLGAGPEIQQIVGGMEPDVEKHGSYVIVEPTTGIPMESRARMQCNLMMRNVNSFGRVAPFSNMYIPIFWLEYNQVGLPTYLSIMMYFTVVVVPKMQGIFSSGLILVGTILLTLGVHRFQQATKASFLYISLDPIPPIA